MADGNVSGSENALGWAIMFIIALIIMGIVWYFFQYDIRSFVRWIRYGEMWVVSWFVDDDYVVPWGAVQMSFDQWFEAVPNLTKEQMNGKVSGQVAMLGLYPMRWVVTVIFVMMAIWSMFKGPNTQYRKTHTLGSFIKVQANKFPYITPFIEFNPSNQPPRPPGAPVPAELPTFAEALGPEEWLAYEGIPVPDGTVDAGAAKRAFAKQLGRPWRGWSHLPKHKQVLLASFCLKAGRKRDESDAILGEMAMSWTHKGGLKIPSQVLKRSRAILKNRELSGKILAVCNQHAYENTAMLRALLKARDEGGVLSPSQFVWLRAVDRFLWYPLNNLGRQTYHMEAIGAMSHYRVEKLTQRPVLRPRVDDAVMKISEYMASERARPIPALDYSNSKNKRGVKKVRGS